VLGACPVLAMPNTPAHVAVGYAWLSAVPSTAALVLPLPLRYAKPFPQGSVQTAALALRDVVEGGYDHFLLHFGDLSYGEGDVSDWDHWARVMLE
jgi:hypothetical protein